MHSTNVVTAPQGEPFYSARCDNPNAHAHAIAHVRATVPRPADYHVHGGGDASVLVVVDPGGQVVDERIVTSSGYAELDALALDTARRTTWAPARFNCEPIADQGVFVLRDESGVTPRASV